MFFLSFFLVIISSYLITSCLVKNNTKNNIGILYFFLICFGQLVLSFEVLSLLSLIKQVPFLITNLIVFILSTSLWLKNNRPIYKLEIKEEFNKIYQAIKLDKILLFLTIIFLFGIFFNFITALTTYPAKFGDALSYYLPRCITWIQNTNINHFITPDTRELIMPVNMEFLYTWVLLFFKKEIGISLFSFISFLGSIYVIYNLLGELNFCRRKRLFAIYLFSGLCIINQMSISTCADLFIGSLLLTGIYLFLNYLKNQNKASLYFSTLACALAFGTKSTAIIAFPSVCIIFFVLNYLYKKEDLKKNIILYILLVSINFIIFSSYNYILNFIQFNNPISCNEQFLLNKFRGGIQGYLCNFSKYLFSFFDCSGIENIDFYNHFINNLQNKFFGLFNLTKESCTSPFFNGYFDINSSITLAEVGLGALGLFALIPAFFISLVKVIKNRLNKRNIIILILGLSLLFNILIFSRVMVFTEYNIRYLVGFIVIASPILATMYISSNKNLFKWLLTCFLCIYLFNIPMTCMLNSLAEKNESALRGEEEIFNYFINKQNTKLGLFATDNYVALSDITKLKLHNIEIDKILIDEIEDYDLDKYDYLIIKPEIISSTNINNFDKYINKENNKVQCNYYDYERQIVTKNNQKPIAKVECIIPLDYLFENNFEEIKEKRFYEYIILKNKSHTNV